MLEKRRRAARFNGEGEGGLMVTSDSYSAKFHKLKRFGKRLCLAAGHPSQKRNIQAAAPLLTSLTYSAVCFVTRPRKQSKTHLNPTPEKIVRPSGLILKPVTRLLITA